MMSMIYQNAHVLRGKYVKTEKYKIPYLYDLEWTMDSLITFADARLPVSWVVPKKRHRKHMDQDLKPSKLSFLLLISKGERNLP